MVKRALIFLVVVTVLVSLIAYSQYRPPLNRVSGFIEAHEIRLGSRVGGRVAKVMIQEGQRVTRGQSLVELEPFDLLELERQAVATAAAREAEYERLRAGLRPEETAQAEARFKRLQARLELLKNGPRPQEIKVAEGNLAVAKSDLKLSEQNFERVSNLVKKGASTQEEFDRITEGRRAAEASLIVREQQLSLLQEGTRREELAEATAQVEEARQAWQMAKLGFRREEIEAAKAARDAAQAAVAALQEKKKELQIKTPERAAADERFTDDQASSAPQVSESPSEKPFVVEALELRPGDLTPPGAPVLSIVDSSLLWVRAYIPENRLNIERGQQLWVTVDSYPKERFAGEVTFISRQAEFIPSNIQTPDERIKQVFRIKVTLLKEGREKLKPGMSADVWLDTIDKP